jgi:hypothetical protein
MEDGIIGSSGDFLEGGEWIQLAQDIGAVGGLL